MGIKNTIKKNRKKQIKEAKSRGSPVLSSSGGESGHYTHQSMMRSGLFMPVRRKNIEKKIKSGFLEVKRLVGGKILVTDKKTGVKKVLSENLKGGITFMNK